MQNYICKKSSKTINIDLQQYKSGNINFDVYNSYKNNLCHKIKNAKKTYCGK